MHTILVVCIGNVCRSPVAAAMLRHAFPDKLIWSAGLAALVGQPADSTSKQIAAAHGLDISSHRAQQLTRWMCAEADLILVMENKHRYDLSELYPFVRGKIRCLGDTGDDTSFDIGDPYQKSRADYELAHKAIATGVAHSVRLLTRLL